jgi:UDP-N-acetylmuramate dehydrogenase
MRRGFGLFRTAGQIEAGPATGGTSRVPLLTITENAPLAHYTTLGVGGPARHLAEAVTEEQALEALDRASTEGWPVFVLGSGSNVLFADTGFPGLVLRIATRGIESGNSDLLTAAAGEEWDAFVRHSVKRELAGIECLSGIPGTVGATPVQNVGAYGEEVGDTIHSVRVFDRQTGTLRELSNPECGFGYRSSVFCTSQRDRHVILAVTFKLEPGGRPSVTYPDVESIFGGRAEAVSPWEVRQAVLLIRQSKGMLLDPSDPESRTAGSFFKNPVITEETLRDVEAAARRLGLLAESQGLPQFRTAEGTCKIPAAWLIERTGIRKGYGTGNVSISSRHALAIVTRPGATAAEVLAFAQQIRGRVEAVFGITLELEPVCAGF